MEITNPNGNDNQAIDVFSKTILTPLKSPKPEEYWLRDLAYAALKGALANSFKTARNEVLGEGAWPAPVQEVIEVQEYLYSDAIAYHDEPKAFYLAMDKSQTYRLAGQYNQALKTIDDISHCLNLDSLQAAYKDQWRRFIMTESLIASGQIAKEDIQKYMEDNTGSYVSPTGITLNTSGTDTIKMDYAIGDTVKFNADEISDLYNWDFGDCSTSTVKNPAHVYNAPGIFKITLQQTFKCADVTRVLFVSVYPKPAATFTHIAAVCTGTEGAVFTNATPALNIAAPACTTANAYIPLSAGNTRLLYEWDFNGAAVTDTIKSTQAKLLPSGDHLVQLKATVQRIDGVTNSWKNTSISSIFTDSVHVNPSIKANFVASALSCYADSLHITNNVTDGHEPFTYAWSFGNGTSSTEANPTVKYTAAGVYTIKLKVTDASTCSDTISQVISIPECPTLLGSVQNDTECPVTSIAGLSIICVDSSGNTINGISPVMTDTAGFFSFNIEELQAKGLNTIVGFALQNSSGSTLFNPGFLPINQWIEAGSVSLPVSSVTQTITADTLHINASLGDTLSFSAGSSSLYGWDFGDCNSSQDSIVQHAFAAPGIYEVVLNKGTTCSFQAQITKVNVYPKPVASFSTSQQACSSSLTLENTSPALSFSNPACSHNFTAFSSGNLRVLHEWNFGNGTTVPDTTGGSQHPTLSGGNHIITLKSILQTKTGSLWTNTEFSSIYSDTVNISTPITASFTHDTTFCVSDSVHYTSSVTGGTAPFTYEWTFGDGTSSTEANPIVKYTEAVTYSMQFVVSDATGCHDTVPYHITIPACPDVPASQKDASASWIDFNNDTYLDLFVSRSGLPNSLYQNNAGTLKKVSSGAIVSDSSFINKWGDYNNDSFIDAFTTRKGKSGLFKNNGDGSFTAITSGSLVNDNNATQTFSWGDYDNDGYLDLFMGNNASKDVLYHNNSDGTFSSVPVVKASTAVSSGCAWGDYDNDKLLDLFVTVKGGNNVLYHNNGGGSFSKITAGDIITNNKNTYDPQWVDYDNDGDVDLYISNTSSQPFHVLYENRGNGIFNALSNAIAQDEVQGTSIWSDFDNDGDQDVLIVNITGQGNHFFENTPDATGRPGNFVKMSTGMIITETDAGFGGAAGDYNNDGYNDVFAAAAYSNDANHIFTNTNGCNSWLKVKCQGSISNNTAIGAKVSAKATISGVPTWQTRELHDGSASIASFGFFDAAVIDSLVVKWPASNITQAFTQVPVDQMIFVIENNPLARMGKNKLEGKNTNEAVNTGSANQSLSIYPNPANFGLAMLQFTMVNIDNVTVEVLDMAGKLILTPVNKKECQVGDQQLELNLTGLANGIYYVRFTSSSSSVIQKLSVVR